MNALTPESYRANNCAGMALFFEGALRDGCDQYAPGFSHKASTTGVFYYMGANHEISVERTRTSVGWAQAATAEYRVVLQSGNAEAGSICFSSTTSPSDLDREVVARLAGIFPDFPAPAELI